MGNFWSDYAGFDRDGDGVGDLAYEPRSLFSALLSHEPNLRLFAHSPAQQAVEFTARALPELRPRPTLVDPAPLTRRPNTETASAVAAPSGKAMAALIAAVQRGDHRGEDALVFLHTGGSAGLFAYPEALRAGA